MICLTTSLWDSLRHGCLQWLPELGIGWYPVASAPYNLEYWRRYLAYDRTDTGDRLTAMRLALVAKYWSGELCDVGIGGGRFVIERPGTVGYDVNPYAISWLVSRGLYFDPWQQDIPAATFWDSLEHIHDPAPLLTRIRRYVFVSLPIFSGCDQVLRSKHYRRDEHCWYFTRAGIEAFMERFGFTLVERNDMEQQAGREAIETFVFERLCPEL